MVKNLWVDRPDDLLIRLHLRDVDRGRMLAAADGVNLSELLTRLLEQEAARRVIPDE